MDRALIPELNAALQTLMGGQLSSVIFVQDYWQLDFDSDLLTVLTRMRVTGNGWQVDSGEDQFRNRLCDQIAKLVDRVSIGENEHLTITFGDGSAIEIPLRDEDYTGSEALNFRTRSSPIFWVA